MAELKRWWKKVWCWLTGGHLYNTKDLKSHHIPEKCLTCFIQRCVKCGEWQVYAVNDEVLYSTYPLPKVGVSFDGK